MSFFRRHQNQNNNRQTTGVDHARHTWTASGSDADYNRLQSSANNSNWNINVSKPSSAYGPQYGPQYGSSTDLNRNGIPDHLEGGVGNQPWHSTGSNSWARSSSATYVDQTAPVYPASTRSDWDHYAINHEKALLGDPIPYRDVALNHPMLANNYTDNATYGRNGQPVGRKGKLGQVGPVHTGVAPGMYTGNGPVVAESALDRNGRPLRGNYSTGTVIEDGYHPGYGTAYGPGYANTTGGRWANRDLDRDGIPDRLEGNSAWANRDLDHDGVPDRLEGRGSRSSFGSTPLYGAQGSGWGSGPIFRDVRDTQTPLLPDNPWTHNELGQDYLDGRGNAPTRKDRTVNQNAYGPGYGNGPVYGNNYGPSGRVQHY